MITGGFPQPELKYECACCGRLYTQWMPRCWHGCRESGYLLPRSYRPADVYRPKRPGMTSKELCAIDQRYVKFPSVPELKVGPGSVTIIAGYAGLGKSTLLNLLAGDRCPAIIFNFEEGLSETTGDRLRRLELRRDNLWIEVPNNMAEAYDLIEQRNPKCLAIDSLTVSSFTIRDLSAIAEARQIVVLATNHLNKAGDVAGSSQTTYGADCVIEFTGGVGEWKLTKSRFQPLCSGTLEALKKEEVIHE